MVGNKTVPVLVQAKMVFTFPTVDMREVIACAVLASLSGFPCWEMINAILSHISRYTSSWPFAGGIDGEDSGLPHLILAFPALVREVPTEA